jgi:hypothetical protein
VSFNWESGSPGLAALAGGAGIRLGAQHGTTKMLSNKIVRGNFSKNIIGSFLTIEVVLRFVSDPEFSKNSSPRQM